MEPFSSAALRQSLTGPTPTLPAAWCWSEEGARLHRGWQGYPAGVERALLREVTPLVSALVQPSALVDLGAPEGRALRALASGWRSGTGVLHDVSEARGERAVRALARDLPRVAWHRGTGAPEPPGEGTLYLFLDGDGRDRAELARLLGACARRMRPEDAALVGVDTGGDPEALVAAYRGWGPAYLRAGLGRMVRAAGGRVDAEALAVEARWDPAEASVEAWLRPERRTRVALPRAGLTLELGPDRPMLGRRVAAWTRGSLAAVGASAGLELRAWLLEPDERRALALLQPARKKGRVPGEHEL